MLQLKRGKREQQYAGVGAHFSTFGMAVLFLAGVSLAAPAPTPEPMLTCQSPEIANLPFCDISLPFSERVDDLLPRLNLTDKIGQTGMVASAVPQLGMISYNFGGEALHGVWATCVVDNITTANHKPSGRTLCPTQFPAPVHMSNSWNRDLWAAAADVASTEARALYRHNQLLAETPDGSSCSRSLEGCLGLSYYTPNINLARDPSWGRIEETPGEDPYVNGEYAYAFTKGFQEGYGDMRTGNKYIKASVTVKHFAAYNLEVDLENTDPDEWCGARQNEGGSCQLPNNRHSFNAHVSQRDLFETYLPPFQRAVDAGAGAIMCSYNAVNGEPMCTNKDLIGGTLRAQMGFDGVVATDCGALTDALSHHNRYTTGAKTAGAAIKAGVDSNCGHVFVQALPAALGPNATLTEAELDLSIARLLYARFRLGLFDEGHPESTVPVVDIGDVDVPQHRAVALQAAQEGVTLLQNGARGQLVLPLSKAEHKVVAMIGPMANASMNLLSGYHGTPPFLVSPLDAMRATWGSDNVLYHVGCNVSDPTPGTAPSVAAAVEVAKTADVVVLGLGLCGDNYGGGPPKEDSTCFRIDEAEGMDRWNLTLPGPNTVVTGSQLALFKAVLALNKPTAVFVMSAGPVDLSEIKATGVPIVAAGYGGEYGGQATVDVLTGAYNPGGALTVTVYPEAYRHMASFHDMAMHPAAGNGEAGRTYRFLDETKSAPLWRFGWGLSYTAFDITFAQAPTGSVAVGEDTQWVAAVRNSGKVTGGIAVICYVSALNQTAVPDAPRRSVFDFTRVPILEPGTSHLASFTLRAESRGLWTAAGELVYPTGTFGVVCEAAGVATTPMVHLEVA